MWGGEQLAKPSPMCGANRKERKQGWREQAERRSFGVSSFSYREKIPSAPEGGEERGS